MVDWYSSSTIRDLMRSKAHIIESWVAQGKVDPIDPFYLMFMIWGSTQHYADFEVQVKIVLAKPRLSAADFDKIADNLTHIILKGCGIKIRDTLLKAYRHRVISF